MCSAEILNTYTVVAQLALYSTFTLYTLTPTQISATLLVMSRRFTTHPAYAAGYAYVQDTTGTVPSMHDLPEEMHGAWVAGFHAYQRAQAASVTELTLDDIEVL